MNKNSLIVTYLTRLGSSCLQVDPHWLLSVYTLKTSVTQIAKVNASFDRKVILSYYLV